MKDTKDDDEDDGTPRHEESHDEIMARMNKLSYEIGERHDQDKLLRLQEKKTSRSLQVIAALGVLMLIMIVSFLATCVGGKGKGKGVEGDELGDEQHSMKRVGKAD